MPLDAAFQSLLESAPDAMLLVDGGGKVVLFNDQAERVFGCSRVDILDKPVDLLVPEDVRADHPGHRARYQHHPTTRPMGAGLALRARRWDGSTFPAEISLSAFDTDEGRLVVAAVRDVTEHRQAESRFRGLLESAPDAMVMVDVSGRITMVNSQAEVLFGWRRDELLGQSVDVLVPDSARAAHPRHREQYFAHPTTRPMGAGVELEGRRKDGSTFPAEISLSSFDTAEGLVVSAAIRDVTARKEVEHEARSAREEAVRSQRQAERAQQEAERANRAKSEFLSRMSHELRTPLNAILGFAQLLELDEPRPDQAERVEFILKGGRHLLGLIDEVLDISRIEAGHLHLTLDAVTVRTVFREAIELVTPLAHDHGILIRIDPDAPAELVVRADPQRLKQVVLNLLANAVKYNRPGGEVQVSWRPARTDRVRLSVKDTGIGIRSEVMDRLFLPFERLDQTGSAVGGTGLGLALSRRLIEGMEGRLWADSVHGEGSTFWIELSEAGASAAPGDGHRAGADAGSSDEPGTVSGLARRRRTCILYVEDNLSNLRLVENILVRRRDLELVPTLQGSMALQLATQNKPDLVLLDLDLPDMTGEEVLDRLRADPATAAIPVIIVSADALAASTEALLAKGAFEYLTKPIDVARFLGAIDRALATVASTGAAGNVTRLRSAP